MLELSMSQIRIKRFDKTIPLPIQKTPGAAAFDLYSRQDTTIPPHTVGLVPLNVAIEVPPNYWSLLSSRSSTFKMGLMPANGIGVIDSDYCGDNDEIFFSLFNFTDQAVTVPKATRIAQLVIIKKDDFDVIEVNQLTNPNRGGFGTTGNK
jgi:dUTP pyrophosphatase